MIQEVKPTLINAGGNVRQGKLNGPLVVHGERADRGRCKMLTALQSPFLQNALQRHSLRHLHLDGDSIAIENVEVGSPEGKLFGGSTAQYQTGLTIALVLAPHCIEKSYEC